MQNIEKGAGYPESGGKRFGTVKEFYNSLSSETLDFLDSYGFNNVGLQPEVMLKVEGEENERAVLDAVESFLSSVGEEQKRAAREIAKIVDEVTG